MHLSRFIKQKSYERIIHVLRRHPITFVPTIMLFIALFAIPVVLYLIAAKNFPDVVTNAQIYPLLVLGGSTYYLSIYLFFYAHFIDYYLDIWIVTNDRVIDNEQHGLFHRTTTELELYNIQDVTSQVTGIVGTFFKFGNVTLKTSSVNTNIVFRDVPHPENIRKELIILADEDRKFHNASQTPHKTPTP
ncbi:MAG: PH domain-containing protein [Candidatus Magasanikbacteria bacterium]|nr:PH domain-containing protein [Candidatus Magasanikbacteria bacterium]